MSARLNTAIGLLVFCFLCLTHSNLFGDEGLNLGCVQKFAYCFYGIHFGQWIAGIRADQDLLVS